MRAYASWVLSGSVQDEPHVPFGGVGESGWGQEGGEEDIEVMTEKNGLLFNFSFDSKQDQSLALRE